MNDNNILMKLLKGLKVKYTSSNTMDLYMAHPHRNNLYGLSEMLTLYGVENIAIRLEDKEQIYDIETPFIAFVYIDSKTVAPKGYCMLGSERNFYDYRQNMHIFRRMLPLTDGGKCPPALKNNLCGGLPFYPAFYSVLLISTTNVSILFSKPPINSPLPFILFRPIFASKRLCKK